MFRFLLIIDYLAGIKIRTIYLEKVCWFKWLDFVLSVVLV